jgi:hypothetical protein
MSKRSIAAIRRPKTELDEANGAEAVSDILVTFAKAAGAALRSGGNLGIPDASHNSLVCIAAYPILQRNMNETIRFPNNKKAAENRRPLKGVEGKPAYSAATFRGGSSAPESWISAT